MVESKAACLMLSRPSQKLKTQLATGAATECIQSTSKFREVGANAPFRPSRVPSRSLVGPPPFVLAQVRSCIPSPHLPRPRSPPHSLGNDSTDVALANARRGRLHTVGPVGRRGARFANDIGGIASRGRHRVASLRPSRSRQKRGCLRAIGGGRCRAELEDWRQIGFVTSGIGYAPWGSETV